MLQAGKLVSCCFEPNLVLSVYACVCVLQAGKLVTRCAEPYAEGDLVSVQLDMDQRHIKFLKNGVAQGMGDGLPGARPSVFVCMGA